MDIVFASATQLAEAIRTRSVSATEVVEAHLGQIEHHDPVLNAISISNAEDARIRAGEADTALAHGEVWGPLHGVPFTLKDAYDTVGVRTTVGFPPFAGYVAQTDSTVAARLKEAGAILMGKSNVHMLLADPLQSQNPLFGRTSNPWNPECTPGGSSGGAAVAVASGMTPFEIGTDLAGSIRIPAHFCGIYGLKPTEHRVSLAGVMPNPDNAPRSIRVMSCLGPMARTVEDVVLIYNLIAGHDGRDTEVAPVPIEEPTRIELKGLRVAIAPNFGGLPVAQEIHKAVEKVALDLEALGAMVEEPPLPTLDIQRWVGEAGALIGMMVGAFQPSDHPSPTMEAYLAALERRDNAIRAWESFFTQWDVLICPPSMSTAFSHRDPGTSIKVDGIEMSYWLGNAHTTLFNYTGHPAMVIPYMQDKQGLPIGIQLVARRWGESRLLGIARALTRITGGFQRPKGY